MRRTARPLIVVAAVALIAAACGQYPNVHERAYGNAGVAGNNGNGTVANPGGNGSLDNGGLGGPLGGGDTSFGGDSSGTSGSGSSNPVGTGGSGGGEIGRASCRERV